MRAFIKCKTTKSIWNDLILAHKGPSNTRETKIDALRLKFNAFKAVENDKVNGTFTRIKCLDSDLDVVKDLRSSSEFIADLNVEYHERALLANQKRTLNLGLWYLKGSGVDQKAYSDSDYAGCNLDRKSTLGGCQILGEKLVCWSAKKQSSVAMSSPDVDIDVVDEILEEDFDALLDKGSQILHSLEGTILEEKLFIGFHEFIAMTTDENSKSKTEEEPEFEKITINIDYKIKTSLEEPPTNLELNLFLII
nr:retrovirus-related Pol polyprotein from transposon TNT 1-94 [Tanacetum cinerariifolium]